MSKKMEVPICFNLDNLGKNISKNKKLVVLLLIGILVFFLGSTATGSIHLNIVNPGFEGAKVNCYGVVIKSSGATTGWSGLNSIHFVGDNEIPIASAGILKPSESYYWGPSSGASQFTIQHFAYKYYTYSPTVLTEHQLSTEVESNIQLQDFNYQNSTPLAIPETNDPTLADYIQYWHLSANSAITSSNSTNSTGYITTTITNSTTYTLTKQNILLVPGNFHLDVWLVPSQDNSNTGSGWEEGTFSNLELWYTLYWYDWLNSLGPVIGKDPDPPTIPDGAINRESLFKVRGGVPISAWIQNYYMPITTDSGQSYDLLKVQTSDKLTLAGSQLPADVLSSLKAMVQNGMTPSLGGRYLDLYTEPSDQFGYVNLQPSNISAAALANADSPVPDSQTQLPNQYFKIGVQGLGTVTVAHGIFGAGPYTVYYPEVSYLIRVIMAVYGTHTYVWTVKTATEQGYNTVTTLPNGTQVVTSGWENRTIQATTGGGGLVWPTFDLGSFLSPANLEFLLILGAIVLLAVTVFNPGVWANILNRGSQTHKPRKGKKL